MKESIKSLEHNELGIYSRHCDLGLWVKPPGKEIGGIHESIKCGIVLTDIHGEEVESLLTSEEVVFLYESLGKLIKKYKIK